MNRWRVAGLVVLAAATAASAQRLAFDAVSIKVSAPSTTGLFRASTPGDLMVEGITMQELIVRAYKVLPSQILGLPAWAATERFDIQAKMMDPVNDPAVARMMSEGKMGRTSAALVLQPERIQSLLADYFHLKVEKSSREMTVYALVVAKPGKLHEVSAGSSYRIQPGVIRGEGIPINVIVSQMAYALDHVLVDRTGLGGYYTMDLNWNPDEGPTSMSTAPSLRTALQEQLGLKIETQKAPIPVLLVTHVERPEAN